MKKKGLSYGHPQASYASVSSFDQPDDDQVKKNEENKQCLDKQMEGLKSTWLDDRKLGFSGFIGLFDTSSSFKSIASQIIDEEANKLVSQQQEEVGLGLQAFKKEVRFTGTSDEEDNTTLRLNNVTRQPIVALNEKKNFHQVRKNETEQPCSLARCTWLDDRKLWFSGCDREVDTSLCLATVRQPNEKGVSNNVVSQEVQFQAFKKRVCVSRLIEEVDGKLYDQRESSSNTSGKGFPVPIPKRRKITHDHRRVTGNIQPADDEFPINKKLEYTDVNKACRLLLPKRFVLQYITCFLSNEQISEVKNKEGMDVAINDLDTGDEYKLKLKLSTKMKAYVLRSNWMTMFVDRRGLVAGDVVGFKFYAQGTRFDFKVLSKAAKTAT